MRTLQKLFLKINFSEHWNQPKACHNPKVICSRSMGDSGREQWAWWCCNLAFVIPFPSTAVALKVNLITKISGKTNSLSIAGGEKWIWSFLKSPNPENCHYPIFLAAPSKGLISTMFVSDLIVPSMWISLLTRYLSKTISENRLKPQLAKVVAPTEADKRL